MKKTLSIAIFLALVLALMGAGKPQVSPFESQADLVPRSRIDELVFGRLKALGIQPAYLCSDAVFIRRIYLDVIGTLPTAKEARQFLNSQDLNKRSKWIDYLLEREEFVDYRAIKWGDLLRVKAEFPINLWPNAVQAYHRWIRTSISENMPYDQFVREMLTVSGSNFRVPQVNFYRANQSKEPQEIAKTVALTFMGVQAEKWPEDRLANFTAFFSQIGFKRTAEWKEEIVFFDFEKMSVERSSEGAIFPDGTSVQLKVGEDPRKVFADWLIQPENPWFARNIVNRIWCRLLGRGIIHEPDDIRPDNPASNPELLAYLEQELNTGIAEYGRGKNDYENRTRFRISRASPGWNTNFSKGSITIRSAWHSWLAACRSCKTRCPDHSRASKSSGGYPDLDVGGTFASGHVRSQTGRRL